MSHLTRPSHEIRSPFIPAHGRTVGGLAGSPQAFDLLEEGQERTSPRPSTRRWMVEGAIAPTADPCDCTSTFADRPMAPTTAALPSVTPRNVGTVVSSRSAAFVSRDAEPSPPISLSPRSPTSRLACSRSSSSGRSSERCSPWNAPSLCGPAAVAGARCAADRRTWLGAAWLRLTLSTAGKLVRYEAQLDPGPEPGVGSRQCVRREARLGVTSMNCSPRRRSGRNGLAVHSDTLDLRHVRRSDEGANRDGTTTDVHTNTRHDRR